MKNLQIDEQDLKILFVCTSSAYKEYPYFKDFKIMCEKAYLRYAENQEDYKTYSEWVNGQIISLTN